MNQATNTALSLAAMLERDGMDRTQAFTKAIATVREPARAMRDAAVRTMAMRDAAIGESQSKLVSLFVKSGMTREQACAKACEVSLKDSARKAATSGASTSTPAAVTLSDKQEINKLRDLYVRSGMSAERAALTARDTWSRHVASKR